MLAIAYMMGTNVWNAVTSGKADQTASALLQNSCWGQTTDSMQRRPQCACMLAVAYMHDSHVWNATVLAM